MNSKGYDSAVLDKSSKNFNAIRGQEQYLIEKHGEQNHGAEHRVI